MKYSLGPVLWYWPKETLQAFYQAAAHSEAEIIYLGESVCSKRRSTKAADWLALAKTQEPIVVYMGLKNIGAIAKLLMQGGRAATTPVAVIMSATTEQERIFISKLESIAGDAMRENFEAPALIVIGEIVSMRERLGVSQA